MDRQYWVNEIDPDTGQKLRKKRILHTKGNPNSRALERQLHSKLGELNALVIDLIKNKRSISHTLIKKLWIRENTSLFSEWMTKWYEERRRAKNHRPNTIKNNRVLIKSVKEFEQYHGKKAVGQITIDWLAEIQKWYLAQRQQNRRGVWTGKGLSQWNAVQMVKSLGIFLKGAVVDGDLPTNVYREFVDKGMLEKRKDKVGVFLDPVEVERLETAYLNKEMLDYRRMQNGEPSRYGRDRHDALAIILFSIYTGLRFSDLKKVEARHPDVTITDSHLIVIMDKTGRAVKLKITSKMRMVANLSKTGPVFPIEVGGNSTANNRINRILNALEIDKEPNMHGLRRTFGCYLLAKGQRLKVVSKLLGHSSVAVTEKHYAKLIDDSLDEGMDVFDENEEVRKKTSEEIWEELRCLLHEEGANRELLQGIRRFLHSVDDGGGANLENQYQTRLVIA